MQETVLFSHSMEERLQKVIARAGVCSRRQAEQRIVDGRVAVNGRIVTELGFKVDPDQSVVAVDGRPIRQEERKICILLHKPRGYVTTMSDPQGRPIVSDLLPDIEERLFPVGRLDMDSEGALIMTNDGELANRILHPRFEVNKTYQATLRTPPSAADLERLAQGVVVDGRKTWPAKLRLLRQDRNSATIEVVIHEGRKRQVRKMFQVVGHPVLRLKRTAYGGLQLGSLGCGNYRILGKNDLEKMFS